jgi:Protein of unknown function (DUF2934)
MSENFAGARLVADAAIRTRIRKRAYKIYCDRDQQEGLALQDWLQAEAEVLNEVRLGPLAATSVCLETEAYWSKSG